MAPCMQLQLDVIVKWTRQNYFKSTREFEECTPVVWPQGAIYCTRSRLPYAGSAITELV